MSKSTVGKIHLTAHGAYLKIEDRFHIESPDPYRYYLKYGNRNESQVSREQFLTAERESGFHTEQNQIDKLATGGFVTNSLIGRVMLI